MIDLTGLKVIRSQNSSSKGNQFKWFKDGIWYKADYLGYEGLAEVVASDILQYSNFDRYCKYQPEKIKINDEVYSGCKSEDFLHKGETLLTLEKLGLLYKNSSLGMFLAGHAMFDDKIRITMDFIRSLNISGADRYLTALIEFDALILNEDRHTNNICCIRRQDGLHIGPVFDNGCSFLSNTGMHSMKKEPEYLINETEARPFSKSFSIQKKYMEAETGVVFKTAYDMTKLRNVLDKCADYYPDSMLSRVEKVVEIQLQKYPELQFEKERDEFER